MKSLLLSISPAALEAFCRALLMLAGSLFSPTWWLLKPALSSLIPLDRILAQGIQPDTAQQISQHLQALGPDIIATQLMPLLALCLMLSIAMLWVYAKLGQLLARYINKRLQPHPV